MQQYNSELNHSEKVLFDEDLERLFQLVDQACDASVVSWRGANAADFISDLFSSTQRLQSRVSTVRSSTVAFESKLQALALCPMLTRRDPLAIELAHDKARVDTRVAEVAGTMAEISRLVTVTR